MILCFDIGGTAIKVAEAFSATDLRFRGRVPTPARDYDAFIAVLTEAIGGSSQPPSGLAFSIAGVIDPDSGRATVANIPCLDGRRIQADLESGLGLPVVLANDADCFALAEATVGAGRGQDVVFGVILGTGVGGGVVVRGELINVGGFAGEWGHGPMAQRIVGQPEVTLPAVPCGCGQVGCLDAVCSARGMERLHNHLTPGATASSEVIIAGWLAGDPAATLTVTIWLELISGPLAMIENLLGAGIMVVGGGLSNARPLVAALDQAVRARTLRRFARPLVVPAECTIEPGLVGAAILGLRRAGTSAA